MTTPATEAGRALLKALDDAVAERRQRGAGADGIDAATRAIRLAIPAIEAEAEADGYAEGLLGSGGGEP